MFQFLLDIMESVTVQTHTRSEKGSVVNSGKERSFDLDVGGLKFTITQISPRVPWLSTCVRKQTQVLTKEEGERSNLLKVSKIH